MKNIYLIFFVIILSGCSTQKVTKKEKSKNSAIELASILTIQGTDSLYINELRFNRVRSSLYTKQMMFERFGKWDKEIRPNNQRHPILVWENRKILESQSELYSVATDGVEDYDEMYSSIVVFDSKNNDCLNEFSKTKDLLVEYFTRSMRKLSSDKEFYKVYWEMVNEFDNRK